MRSPCVWALVVLLRAMPGLAQQPVQQPIQVAPWLETQPVLGSGTAVQGVSVWFDPTRTVSDLLLVADFQEGLVSYRLFNGRRLGLLVSGALTGVDVQEDFPTDADGGTQPLVMVANASVGLLGYFIDPRYNLAMEFPGAAFSTGFAPSAVAVYHSPSTQRFYAFAGSAQGTVSQFELTPSGHAGDSPAPVRTLEVGGSVVGLAVDDALGALYVVQQDVGIWRYGAEPGASAGNRVSVASVADGGIAGPLGGVALYTPAGDRGYLLAASQGESAVYVYDRALATHTYRGRFSVVADGGIDAVDSPRVLAVNNRSLPGLVAVHDGLNGPSTDNFKFVSWPFLAGGFSPPLITDFSAPRPPEDGGTPDAGAVDGGDNSPLASVPIGDSIGIAPTPSSCGCAAASLPGSVLLGLAGVLLLSRRRSGA